MKRFYNHSQPKLNFYGKKQDPEPETALAPLPTEVTALATPQDESFDQIARSSDFLPRIKVADSNCLEVKQGLVQVGNWLLIQGQTVKDLGKEITVIVLDWRSLAMQLQGDTPVAVSYTQTSDLFKEIAKKSGIQNSGAIYGPQFLVWLPDEKLLVTWYASSKTARNESSKLKGNFSRALTWKTRLIEANGYSWFGPVILPCSTPVEVLPDPTAMQEEVTKFKTVQPDFVKEAAPAQAAAGRAR